MFKRNLQPKLRNQTYVATFSMLLGVSSTHTPLIVVESLKCDTFGIGNVHTNTHTHKHFIPSPNIRISSNTKDSSKSKKLLNGHLLTRWMNPRHVFFSREMDGIPVVMGKFGNFGILEVGIQATRKFVFSHFCFFLSRVWESMKCAMQIWLIWVVFGQTWCLDVFFHRYAFFQQLTV